MRADVLGGGRAPSAANLSVGIPDDAAKSSLTTPVTQVTPLTFDELRHRLGERHADHMARLREAGIFTSWPAVLDGELPRPFRMGIDEALVLRLDRQRCQPSTLHALIGRLCRSRLYLEGLARAGAQRHNIDGEPVEPVSDEHRVGARAWLDHRARLRKERERLATSRRHHCDAPGQGPNATWPILRVSRRAPAEPVLDDR